nr:MAG TPA: hypothetical protein [Herelleviridae sp.]
MKGARHFLKKLLFITISLSIMILLCKVILNYFGVEKYLRLHTIIGGGFLTLIATRLFDRYSRKRYNEQVNAKLREALHDLKEIKSIINR